MIRIVVTGGAGFIGSAFINTLLEKNKDVAVLCVDKLTYAGNRDNIKHDVAFLQKDICDVTVEDLGEYDYIVHFAAESHVDNSILDGRPFVRTNVEGTYNLLECARRNPRLKKFVHISTDEVYGDMDNFAWSPNHMAQEGDSLFPSSYYSSTKASSDLLVMSAHRTFGLPYLITRTCNNFGEHQDPEKFLPKIYKSIMNDLEVPLYGEGDQVREWMYVYDNVGVIIDLMFDGNVINEIYNIGSGIHFKNIDIINTISEIIGKPVKFKHVEDRLGHDRRYSLQLHKINSYYRSKEIQFKCLHLKDFLLNLYKKNN
jgi:dTDP-glucose 4,6-dehydratase